MDATDIASQVGAVAGLWTKTPVDWAGNESDPPLLEPPEDWPSDAFVAVPPAGSRPLLLPGTPNTQELEMPRRTMLPPHGRFTLGL